ncbi:MAG: VanZ family protein [Chitinophagaceae bacterium]|nr:VanZ family protein [Chitinophagaceae bacterium]
MKPRIPFKGFLPAIIWFIILCFLFYLPGKEVPSIGWMERLHVDKAVHFFLFAVLVFLVFKPLLFSDATVSFKNKWLVIIAAAAVIYGIVTEFIQLYFIPGRSFDIWDWVADSCGVIITVYLVRKFLKAYF